MDRDRATVSVFDHGLLDGCFEGIRFYNGRIFKLQSHLNQLYDSARRNRLEPRYDIETLLSMTREAVERTA